VIDKLPLDSPLWGELTACYSNLNAVDQLRAIVVSRELGEAWRALCDEVLHQGTVYQVSSAVLPHLVEIAPELSVVERRDLWIQVGFLVTAGADRFPSPPLPGLQDGLTAALGIAETQAVRDFLVDTEASPDESSYFALACLALAGHRVGQAIWEFLSPGEGYVRVRCPACDSEAEVDGFGDPLALPCAVPEVGPATGRSPASWRAVADAIGRLLHEGSLGPGWEDALEAAAWIAAHGVPAATARAAVWGLVSAMVATTSARAAPWARTLARLAGHVRCLDCGSVWVIADVMGDGAGAEPVDLVDEATAVAQTELFTVDTSARSRETQSGDRVSPTSVADAIAGFPIAPGRRLARVEVPAQVRWRTDIGAVRALGTVAGQPSIIVAGTDDVATVWDVRSGSRVGVPLPGPALSLASLPLPDHRTVIVTASDDGSLRWWDAATAEPLGTPTTNASPVLSLAAVFMAPNPIPRTVDWLRELRDNRTMLAVGDAGGAVTLWDPVTRTPVRTLLQRTGQPVACMTTVESSNVSRPDDLDLVAVCDGRIVEVWPTTAVHGQPSTMAPDLRKIAAIGHQRILGAAASPRRLGGRKPLLLADRNGTVSMWETFGIRLGDPLPPDPAHREVAGMVAWPDQDGDITVATASRTDRNLRLWHPLRAEVAFVALDDEPLCLLHSDGALVVGHDRGLTVVSVG